MKRLSSVIFLFFFFCFLSFHASADSIRQAFDHADADNWSAARAAAARTGRQPLIDYIDWRRYRKIDQRASGREILSFIERHPLWPERKSLLQRAEEALVLGSLDAATARRWQNLYREIHGSAATGENDAIQHLVTRAWIEGEFTVPEAKAVLERHGSRLTREHHAARVERLLWEGKIPQARALIPRLSEGQQNLAYARLALMTNQPGVERLISAVPASLRNNPSLQYERMVWRDRKNLDSGVREILLAAPSRVPFPGKWWRYRGRMAREAIESRDYRLAEKLLANHGQTEGADLADALWMRGWLYQSFLNNPSKAYEDFYALYHHVSFPVSKSRGAYWAGKAAQANGNNDIAQNWFRLAAQHNTTFYGQLALLEMPGSRLVLPATTGDPKLAKWTSEEKALYDLVGLFDGYNQPYSFDRFVRQLAAVAKNPHKQAALAFRVRQLNEPEWAVRVGKVALQESQQWIGEYSHPLRSVPNNATEKALVLAITRQESEFDPRARSGADARGMMQILPSTAKELARKNKIPFSADRLYEPDYNMRLGSLYLASLLRSYNGNIVLTAAAYNGGPGNVRKWIARFGQPPKDINGMLRWIEMIPFLETRNYVQRIIENRMVYKAMLGESAPLSVERIFKVR